MARLTIHNAYWAAATAVGAYEGNQVGINPIVTLEQQLLNMIENLV